MKIKEIYTIKYKVDKEKEIIQTIALSEDGKTYLLGYWDNIQQTWKEISEFNKED